jgi:outer membrane protein insertion porin family
MRTLFFAALLIVTAFPAWAFEPFVIKDIRVEGLGRIAIGTVLNYLPINEGDTMDDVRSAETIRALFETGLFDDVSLARDEDTLVVKVIERPAISKIEITGNKDITSDQLTEALKGIGLAEGRIFDRSLLDKVERELELQYFSQGKYAVKIKSEVTTLDEGRVDIKITIAEGRVAKIRNINIVGNSAYTDNYLLGKFQLSTQAVFSDNDQYSKQRLAADLETLRSYYLDNGYINFNIDSTQVSITPDKKDVYITINITEGDKFTVKDVKLTGELIVPEKELYDLISIHGGDIFSRRATTESSAAITARLGREGYAFSNVNMIPDIDHETRQVSLTFFVDPGKRVYVDRINIAGNAKTSDEVIRRELRQMEGGWISTDQVSRSRIRLQKLGFFDEVNVETPTVAGTDDQVDVDLSVSERPSGTLMAGLGYSQSQGLLLNASVSQDNFLGSGKRISATVNNSRVNTVYSFAYTNPYYTLNGISRGIRVYDRETDAGAANVADYTSDVYGASIDYGFPISEFNTATLSLGYEHTKLKTTPSTPQSYIDFINANSNEFNLYKLQSGWSHDTRNRAIFADRGLYNSIDAEVALPISGLEFYKLNLRTLGYVPLTEKLTISLKGDIGYGDSYGDTTELPFFEHYYAGGSNSVRGWRSNSLGPQVDGTAEGGALKTVASAELIFPVPFVEDNKSLRLSAFYDIGNVFAGQQDFNVNELRYAVGFAAIWITPIAPLTFSFAWPLNDRPGDTTERFQFTLGSFFF